MTQLTALELEIYAGSVMHDYIVTDAFGTDTMMYFGPKDSEVLNQPIVTHGDPKFLDDGTDHTNEDASMRGVEINLFDPVKVSNRIKRRTVDERPGLRHLAELGKSHGLSIARHKNLMLLNALAKWATAAGNVISVPLNGSNDPDDVKAAFKTVAANLDEAEVDNADRWCMLKSTPFYELADQDGVMSVDFGGPANRQDIGGNGAGLRYLNINIKNLGIGFGNDYTATAYSSWNIPNHASEGGDIASDLSAVLGVVWQKRSWALRDQAMPSSAVDWIARLQVWQALSRYQFGCDYLSPNGAASGIDGIWVITDASV